MEKRVTPLARLNEPSGSALTLVHIEKMVRDHVGPTLNTLFGFETVTEKTTFEIAKALSRYHSAAQHALKPDPKPQTKELIALSRALRRVDQAFKSLSEQNRHDLNAAIMFRDPFNRRFYFKEQMDYWKRTERMVKDTAANVQLVEFGIELLFAKREKYKLEPKATPNQPLDHLIEDLRFDFLWGTGKEARTCCYYSSNDDCYVGQYFDFVLFLLKCFAPKSYHSELALGKRIVRVLSRL